MKETALIIGAGPAGLTAAYELITKTDILPIIIEKTSDVGGISKTIVHNGNRIDIGGHRFFSKSYVVMNWWQNILPLQGSNSNDEKVIDVYYRKSKSRIKLNPQGPDPDKTDRVMLIRNRVSRVFYLKKFFDYPITINSTTLFNLGFFRIFKIGFSYLWIKVHPVKNIQSLEDFFISRFGKELYKTFFKDYTEKVWGVPCTEIPADWGAQRIKELSVTKALKHALRSLWRKQSSIEQKDTETSLIENFMYPKLGPGQMWETVLETIEKKGGKIIRNAEVTELTLNGKQISQIGYIDQKTQEKHLLTGDYFFSSMPVKDLIHSFTNKVPNEVRKVSEGLMYRDFITVGLLLTKLKIKNKTGIKVLNDLIPDCWIYIQEHNVKVGRLQVFNNWSPYLLKDPGKVWIGLEYFCNEGDSLWEMEDNEFITFAINELHSIEIINKKDVIDSTIIRMPKTYPAYFGTYPEFGRIREYTDQIENLFLVGRNGMHKYNNQDHSMLTSMAAVENIIKGIKSKDNIWNVNSESEYHEEK
ncbi:MAG: NAD(P)/FAD-dependent oxidoreductase [Prolixibacteraceae bacterium]|jgi:protoporphyrinogen oxidase|nr:NAD(P)/FAD-dependent oxidoreductase [Prolixibacteraceae bacterium]